MAQKKIERKKELDRRRQRRAQRSSSFQSLTSAQHHVLQRQNN